MSSNVNKNFEDYIEDSIKISSIPIGDTIEVSKRNILRKIKNSRKNNFFSIFNLVIVNSVTLCMITFLVLPIFTKNDENLINEVDSVLISIDSEVKSLNDEDTQLNIIYGEVEELSE